MPEHCWHELHAAYIPNFGDWGHDGNSITGDSCPVQWDTLSFPEHNPQRLSRTPSEVVQGALQPPVLFRHFWSTQAPKIPCVHALPQTQITCSSSETL